MSEVRTVTLRFRNPRFNVAFGTPRVTRIPEITSNDLCQADFRTIRLEIKEANRIGLTRRLRNSQEIFTSGFATESCKGVAAARRLERVRSQQLERRPDEVADTPQCDLSQLRDQMQDSVHPTVQLIGNDALALETAGKLVRSIGFGVDPYLSPDEFLRRHDDARPGCVVADLDNVANRGIAILRELNEAESPLPVVFVASQANVADAVSLMQSGAVTLLEKPYRNGTFVDSVRSAVRLDAERRRVAVRCSELDQRFRRLSEDERDVLRELLAGQANKQIAFSRGIALRTVEYRRSHIFSKLEVHSIAEAAAAVSEFERLTEISALLKAPPIRMTDSRFISFGMPIWMRTVSRNHTVLNPPHAGPHEPARRDKHLRDYVTG